MSAADELDSRKSIKQLYKEWDGCTKCELGQRRERIETKMVPGRGRHHAIMLVGDAPSAVEEGMGKSLLDASGDMLREIMKSLDILDAVYLTNAVCCRSCRQQENEQGQPVMRERGGYMEPLWEEYPPPKSCLAACRPRLQQEIYTVDPVIIVAMGSAAIETLFGKGISVRSKSGKVEAETVTIPGVGYLPSLTEKCGQWIRSYSLEKGFVMPTVPATVEYTMIPTYNHNYVHTHVMDAKPGSPFDTLNTALRTAAIIYERCMLETYGYVPHATEDSDDEQTIN